jgi:formylglycine-generating enzyme required for sulfatase activity
MEPWADSQEGICGRANVSDLARREAHSTAPREATRYFDCRDGFVYAAPVGGSPADPWGLHDMLGNVWEWVEDCSFELYPPAPVDGSAVQTSGVCEKRAVRGGSWYARQDRHRPSFRGRDPEHKTSHQFGFRVARDLAVGAAVARDPAAPAFTATSRLRPAVDHRPEVP